jgi:hypothetical protein
MQNLDPDRYAIQVPPRRNRAGFLQSIRRQGARTSGSLQLRDYPGDIVRLSCAKCGRSGLYRKQNLIERYGADIRLPDLREEIAKRERRGLMHDACLGRYVDLVS